MRLLITFLTLLPLMDEICANAVKKWDQEHVQDMQKTVRYQCFRLSLS
jgi:hypothetical protein